MKRRNHIHRDMFQGLDRIQRIRAMVMVRLPVGSGQIRMGMDNRIGGIMVNMRKGNTSCIVTYEKHYQQVFQYRMTQIFHFP